MFNLLHSLLQTCIIILLTLAKHRPMGIAKRIDIEVTLLGKTPQKEYERLLGLLHPATRHTSTAIQQKQVFSPRNLHIELELAVLELGFEGVIDGQIAETWDEGDEGGGAGVGAADYADGLLEALDRVLESEVASWFACLLHYQCG